MDIQPAKVIGEELLCSGKWLRLKVVKWQDQNGKERRWETLERTSHGLDREVDAVEIVPILKKKGQPNQLVVIKQFRPPTGQYIIELPAGLVDEKEVPAKSAIRELREETGYVGKVVDDGPAIIFGMAISNTTCKIVTIEIDGDLPENLTPTPALEEGEFAEVILVPMDRILETMEVYRKEGCGIDGKIMMIGALMYRLL
eukprot:TRINITY_DN1571_c0_g1_i1.p1 TRINITY_DN1571_c0_g1~~TRINITY_DN1571_c0_g1_i1.p1  ORF type:complete len:213 (+),score=36.43 TRINITY_DN1571_c0_g1_i1:40-639(+)